MLHLKYRRLFMGLPIENLLRATSRSHGNNEYRQIGHQSDFSEYKSYERGDNLKDVDWKVYARREKVHVKKFSSEHAKSVYLFIDSSKSMEVDFLGNKSLKKNVLLSLIDYFMDYLMMHKEKFLVSFLENPQTPNKLTIESATVSTGQKAFHQAKSMINNYKPYKDIDMKRQMMHACEIVEPHSNVFVFSDFYVDFEDILKVKAVLTKKNSHLHLMHLIDKDELSKNTKRSKMNWVVDSETGEKILFDWGRQFKIYHRFISEHVESYYKYALQADIRHHPLNTSEDPLNLFIGLFKQ